MANIFGQSRQGLAWELGRIGPPDHNEVVVALHEAAHAVVGMWAGFRVTGVRIEQKRSGRYPWSGECTFQTLDDDSEGAGAHRSYFYAAPFAAQQLRLLRAEITAPSAFPDDAWVESDDRDFRSEVDALYSGKGTVRPDEFLRNWRAVAVDEATKVLKRHKRDLETVTYLLLRDGAMTEDQLAYACPDLHAEWWTSEWYSAPTRSISPAPGRRQDPRGRGYQRSSIEYRDAGMIGLLR